MNNDLERLPGFDDWPYDLSLLGFEEGWENHECEFRLTISSESLNKVWVYKDDHFSYPCRLRKRLDLANVSGNTLAVGVYRTSDSSYISSHVFSPDPDWYHYKIVLAKHILDVLGDEETLNVFRAWLLQDNEVCHGN